MKHPKMYEGKSPVHKLYWFQYFLIDVILFYLFIIYIFFKIMKFIFSQVMSCCKGKKKEKVEWKNVIQVILFEIDFAIFYTNLHELFCQFISWTDWVNSGKSMDNCWLSCQVMADMEIFYNDLMIINLYII